MRLVVLTALALVVTASTAGAATTRLAADGTIVLDGRRIFPLVLSKGPPLSGYAEVASAGVNIVRTGPTGTWDDAELGAAVAANAAAAANGLHTWVNLSSLSTAAPLSPEEETLRRVVATLEAHPGGRAVALWKGADEPWHFLVGPEWLRFAYCLGTGRGPRSWCAGRRPLDTDHLWVTIQAPRGAIPRLARYGRVTDVHGVNRYPIAIGDAQPDLDEVGRWTNMLRWATPSRSVWTTLQVCWTWSYDAAGNFVLPTFEQERFMAYDAIVNGATALAFYGANNPKCWSEADAERGWNWTFWNATLAPLVREVGAGSPIAPALVQPGSTRWLRTSVPETQAILRRGARGEWWLIATHGGERSDVLIEGLPRWASRATVYTEGRVVEVSGGTLADAFDRWAVHVYRLRAGD